MNNPAYRKTMENLRGRIDVDYLKWTSKPSYTSHKIFDNYLVAICKNKVPLTFNKPAYNPTFLHSNSMCILELSKILMYKFHYLYIKNKYGSDSRLLFTDTATLMYEIKTEDIYEDFSNDKKNV